MYTAAWEQYIGQADVTERDLAAGWQQGMSPRWFSARGSASGRTDREKSACFYGIETFSGVEYELSSPEALTAVAA
jgi:hypothetical protein